MSSNLLVTVEHWTRRCLKSFPIASILITRQLVKFTIYWIHTSSPLMSSWSIVNALSLVFLLRQKEQQWTRWHEHKFGPPLHSWFSEIWILANQLFVKCSKVRRACNNTNKVFLQINQKSIMSVWRVLSKECETWTTFKDHVAPPSKVFGFVNGTVKCCGVWS